MIVAGLVIDVVPECAQAAILALQERPGVAQVEGPVTPGRLVAVIEAGDNRTLDELVQEMLATKGVVSVNPAYIHFDA